MAKRGWGGKDCGGGGGGKMLIWPGLVTMVGSLPF